MVADFGNEDCRYRHQIYSAIRFPRDWIVVDTENQPPLPLDIDSELLVSILAELVPSFRAGRRHMSEAWCRAQCSHANPDRLRKLAVLLLQRLGVVQDLGERLYDRGDAVFGVLAGGRDGTYQWAKTGFG